MFYIVDNGGEYSDHTIFFFEVPAALYETDGANIDALLSDAVGRILVKTSVIEFRDPSTFSSLGSVLTPDLFFWTVGRALRDSTEASPVFDGGRFKEAKYQLTPIMGRWGYMSQILYAHLILDWERDIEQKGSCCPHWGYESERQTLLDMVRQYQSMRA